MSEQETTEEAKYYICPKCSNVATAIMIQDAVTDFKCPQCNTCRLSDYKPLPGASRTIHQGYRAEDSIGETA